jgi:predicted RND superfamily exporter protein
MNRLARNIVKHRFIITPILLLITVFTFTLMDDVNTNYDFSKYLPEESTATQDTNIIRDQIEFPLSLSLMVNDIEKTDVAVIKEKLEAIEDVEVVIVDTEDTSNFKDGHALLTIFLQSDSERTDDMGPVIEKIESALQDYDINLSGNHVNTYHQKVKVQEETPMILLVACVVIALILLVTTERYLEPLAFGFVIGVAIVINLGTNIIFPEISYITKSVAAVLQLGLSMDYSIILINNYYREKDHEKNSKQAMINALSNSFKPISSSSLTTVIGLLALLFMSFTIGKDMGLVLAKGIIISLMCVFILLPNVILWLEKVPFNKKHKTLNISSISVKSSNGKVTFGITTFAALFIISMFFVQGHNSYIFTDETKFEDEEAIKEVFGESNTFVIGIKNDEDLYKNEKAIMDKINEQYKDSIISYLGEVNSIQKHITYRDLLDITSEDNAKLILSLYSLDHGQTKEMTYTEYMNELECLISNNTITVTEEMSDLNKVLLIKNMLGESYTSQELLEAGLLPASTDQTMIDLVFNSYHFDHNNVITNKLSLNQFIDALQVVALAHPELVTDSEALESLQALKTQLNSINALLQTEATKAQFQAIAATQFGVNLDEATLTGLYANYFAINGLETSEQIMVKNLLSFMVENNLLPEQNKVMVSALLQANVLVNTPVEYTSITETLNNTIYLLTGSMGTTDLNVNLIKFNYIIALSNVNMISKDSIPFNDLVPYLGALTNDPFISNLLPEGISTDVSTLQSQIALLQNDVTYTRDSIVKVLSETENDDLNKLSSVLFASSLSKTRFINTYEVSVDTLLKYITSQDLGLTESQMVQVNKLQVELNTMKNIITSDSISLIVLNTTLPYESEETRTFIDYIYNDVYKTVDDDIYFIGYSVSDAEIKAYFEDDLLKINFITIGAVLVILIITFQSVIIPLILVFTIEGAIWTTLSFSYVINQDIFFFCYIVIGAIQLGATIDYAIILTTNYQKERKINDKAIALKTALKQSIPAILTSGTILTIAGFAIAFVSSQASIVAVGSFLGRGTLISMIYVVTILPSMLFTFDKLIIKTAKKREETKAKMKQKYNSFL